MPTKRTWRFTLSTQVVLALVLGAKAFILLLQMTLLPYIVLSLSTGLGHLHYQQVKVLALRVGTFLVLSWGLAFVVILLMPLAFPTWQSASFFSTSGPCHGLRSSCPSSRPLACSPSRPAEDTRAQGGT